MRLGKFNDVDISNVNKEDKVDTVDDDSTFNEVDEVTTGYKKNQVVIELC